METSSLKDNIYVPSWDLFYELGSCFETCEPNVGDVQNKQTGFYNSNIKKSFEKYVLTIV